MNRFLDEESLVEAMSKSLDLIGHHACLDFANLASAEKERRAEFFAISQPGGSSDIVILKFSYIVPNKNFKVAKSTFMKKVYGETLGDKRKSLMNTNNNMQKSRKVNGKCSHSRYFS